MALALATGSAFSLWIREIKYHRALTKRCDSYQIVGRLFSGTADNYVASFSGSEARDSHEIICGLIGVEDHSAAKANDANYVISGFHGKFLPNVKDEPRRCLARLVRQHEA